MKHMVPWKRRETMPAVRETVNTPFEVLHRRMNDLFGEFFNESDWPRDEARFSPRFEVAETDDSVAVSAELPGLDAKDVSVTIDGGCLIVRGEKKEEREEKKKNYLYSERRYGSFERVIPLPEGVDEGSVKARFGKGVLNINLSRTPESRKSARKIQIQGE